MASKGVTYRVLSLGLTLTSPKPTEPDRDLATGDTISQADLLTYTRQRYIDAMIAAGDLEVVTDA